MTSDVFKFMAALANDATFNSGGASHISLCADAAQYNL
jgi:hypothetical protein